MDNTEDFFKNYRGKYSQYWIERWGLIPELPTSFDNANSIYELVAWLQRAFKNLLDDFQQLESEFEDFKNATIDLLEYLIPELIRRYHNSAEFRRVFIEMVNDILSGEERTWFKDFLKELLENDMKEWFKDYLKNTLNDPEIKDFFNDYLKQQELGNKLFKKIRGACQNLRYKEDEIGYDFSTMLDKLIDINANTVAICPSFWVDNATSRITGYKDAPSVSKQIIADYCRQAKEKGLQVVLKPHVNGSNFTSFYNVNPTDYRAFIQNYGQWLTDLVRGCAEFIDILSLTNEMDRQTKTNRDLWLNIITEIRLIKSDIILTNSSRTDDLETNVFLDKLDYIGWNCYLNIGDSLEQSIEFQKRNMFFRNNDVNIVIRKSIEYNKPILVTEVGTQAFQGGLSTPEAWSHGNEVGDYDYQIRYMEVVLRSLIVSERVAGTLVWTASGNTGGFGFDILGKPTAKTVKAIYGGN